MIYIVQNMFAAGNNESHEFDGVFIDFLVDRFPHGFGSKKSAVFKNGEIIQVSEYDFQVTEKDTVVILTDIPAGVDPVSWTIILINIAISIAIAGITLLFAPKPKDKNSSRGRVFDIGSGQNVPALGESIAEHFGTLWFYPDVASQPYVEYINNEQYVNQILLIGAGKYEINNSKFGNTELKMITAGLIDSWLFLPNDHKRQYGTIYAATGIHEDVVSSVDVQGIDFARNANTSFCGRVYPAQSNLVKGNVAVSGFKVGDLVTLLAPARGNNRANHQLDATITSISNNSMYLSTMNGGESDNPWYQVVPADASWRGWFSVCAVGKKTNRIDLDFEFQQGLFATNKDGDMELWSCQFNIEIQGVDSNNNNVGDVLQFSVEYVESSRDAIRRTYSIAVPEGRYKIRVEKDDADDIAFSRATARAVWNGLKAYCVNPTGEYAYGNVTLLAIRMKASEALSSTSDKISVQATRILPTILSDFANEEPTTNVVDAFCHIVREVDFSGLDVESLKVLASRWRNTNGFNYRFKDEITVYDALSTVAYSHRAVPTAYSYDLSMRPDDEKPFDQFIITDENYLAESYSCGISIGSTSANTTGVRVEYQDPTSTNKLYVVAPAGSFEPRDFTLDGCTDEATAVAFANYMWVKTKSTKRVVSFETELDALAFNVGDRISIMSNIVDVVATCRVLEVTGNVLTVDAVSESPEVVVKLRDEYGAPSAAINASMSGNEITLATLPPFPIYGIDAPIDSTPVVIGSATAFQRSYIVNEIAPSGNKVSVSCALYSPTPYVYPIPNEDLTP